ncbi:MAG: hypothetical protein ACJAUQ_001876 [Maribacter sp.]|jgi:hypothetical protein
MNRKIRHLFIISINLGLFWLLMVLFVAASCINDRDFDALNAACKSDLQANASFSEVKGLYIGETIQIQEDLIIEGYVVSSDVTGNFFGVLHFQDTPSNPTEAFQIEIDLRDFHLFFAVGDNIRIKLKGLYLGKSKEVYKIGGVFTSFGNISVGRLPFNAVFEHVFISCDDRLEIVPTIIDISELSTIIAGTLVQINNAEFSLDELGLSFAVEREETIRVVFDCSDNEIGMRNSGFSDFQANLLPEGSGSITGLLIKENNDFYIQIRELDDIVFSEERCEDVIDEFTSQNIFFTELADPDNNANARFIEIYNASDTLLSLNGWQIARYTNASLEVSSSLDLSEYTIPEKSTLVIAADAEEFLNVYGFSPDVTGGSNSPADSNGDDNLQLIDPFGTVIDVFGEVGVDGTGTNHEFEDGRAIRKPEVNKANSVYTFAEWLLYNDSGGSGTINLPQIAPENYTPGFRE